MQQFLTLGDFRPGTVSAVPRRCGKSACHCAQPDGAGHLQFRLLRKVKGKSVSESFADARAWSMIFVASSCACWSRTLTVASGASVMIGAVAASNRCRFMQSPDRSSHPRPVPWRSSAAAGLPYTLDPVDLWIPDRAGHDAVGELPQEVFASPRPSGRRATRRDPRGRVPGTGCGRSTRT